jgi:protein translocase SecG subunit
MLYGFLLTLYLINCFLLIIIILMQKGKSSLGFGGLGGGAQMLFGGSGGQDLFQKITWVLGSIFIAGAMFLSLMKSSEHKKFRYLAPDRTITQSSSAKATADRQMPQSPMAEDLE